MGAVIGELLPLAVGIAISPIPMAMVIFTLVAASTVAVPVLGHLAARDRMAAPLDRLPAWLTQHNTAVMAVLLLVIGAALIGKGIAGF
jgi:hypothetical protein